MKSLLIKEDLHTALKIQCSINKQKINEVIQDLIRRWLKEQQYKNN